MSPWLFFWIDSYSFWSRLLMRRAIFYIYINSLLNGHQALPPSRRHIFTGDGKKWDEQGYHYFYVMSHVMQFDVILSFCGVLGIDHTFKQYILYGTNLMKQQITMSFLEKVWEKLALKKEQTLPDKQVEFKQVYKGYRTIHIQDLYRIPRKNNGENPQGSKLWSRKDFKLSTYMQNQRITAKTNNGFFSSFYQAYMNHGDIKIKPDEVWMMIMIWFSKYVDNNAEQLRNAFVKHAGKKELIVITDRDVNNWVPFMQGMIEKIKENTVEKVVEQLQCNFSSTGFFETMFSTALIMNTCKKYFNYTRFGAGCGVVNVHMAGVLEDWEKLQQKLCNLEHFDVDGKLKNYIRGLKPVLQQFTETYKGNAHLQFWNNLYFERIEPNTRAYEPSNFINGWLIKFFTTEDEIGEVKELERFTVDIKYVDLVTKEVTLFVMNGGCKGYACVDNVYTPHYSFAILEDEVATKKLTSKIKSEIAYKARMHTKKVEAKPEKKANNAEKVEKVEKVNKPPLAKKQQPIKHIKIAPKQIFKPVIPPKLQPPAQQKKVQIKVEQNKEKPKETYVKK